MADFHKCGCNWRPVNYEDWCDVHRPRGWAESKKAPVDLVGVRWWMPEEVAAAKIRKLEKIISQRNKLQAQVDKLGAEIYDLERALVAA